MTDTTLIPSPSLRDAAEQKPTTVRSGYWRNRWTDKPGYPWGDGITNLGDGTILTPGRWPTAEIAEQKIHENLPRDIARRRAWGIRYLGPVFFPNEEGGAS